VANVPEMQVPEAFADFKRALLGLSMDSTFANWPSIVESLLK
jgi:hypothetical protein